MCIAEEIRILPVVIAIEIGIYAPLYMYKFHNKNKNGYKVRCMDVHTKDAVNEQMLREPWLLQQRDQSRCI